jgi:uncharacterized protein YneF (UPF0154 family)
MRRIIVIQENPIKSFLLFLLPLLIGIILGYIFLNIKIYRDCVEKKSYVTDDFKIDCKLSTADY